MLISCLRSEMPLVERGDELIDVALENWSVPEAPL
jgi:hypothetical protein